MAVVTHSVAAAAAVEVPPSQVPVREPPSTLRLGTDVVVEEVWWQDEIAHDGAADASSALEASVVAEVRSL